MRIVFIVIAALITTAASAQNVKIGDTFDLGGKRALQPQYFLLQNHYIKYAPDGDRMAHEYYKVLLSCVPGEDGDVYTCHRFTIDLKGKEEKSIIELRDWTYLFHPGDDGLDDQGQVLSIPHSQFEELTTGDGGAIDIEHSYAVYNTFIDFHAFNDVFARPSGEENGIEDLRAVGDVIVHSAAFSEPPVNLGADIKEGSVFRNGEITMLFKGVSFVNEAVCALVGFDSGESSFSMNVEAMPDMIVASNGSSHYFGDIYIDLDTHWLQKAEMAEFVVSETVVPNVDMKIHGIIEREVKIRNMDKDEFSALLGD